MDADNAMVVYMLVCTGLGIGEALALRCGDADLNCNRINVLRTQSVDADSRLAETLLKDNRTRFVPVLSRLLPKIKDLLDGHNPEDYLLRGLRGGRQTTTNWRNRVWTTGPSGCGHAGCRGPGNPLPASHIRFPSNQVGADVKTFRPSWAMPLHRDLGHLRGPMAQPYRGDCRSHWPGYPNQISKVPNKCYRAELQSESQALLILDGASARSCAEAPSFEFAVSTFCGE